MHSPYCARIVWICLTSVPEVCPIYADIYHLLKLLNQLKTNISSFLLHQALVLAVLLELLVPVPPACHAVAAWCRQCQAAWCQVPGTYLDLPSIWSYTCMIYVYNMLLIDVNCIFFKYIYICIYLFTSSKNHQSFHHILSFAGSFTADACLEIRQRSRVITRPFVPVSCSVYLMSCMIYRNIWIVLYSDTKGRVHRRKFRSQTSDDMDRWKAE